MMEDLRAERLEAAELLKEATKSLSREDELDTGTVERGPMMRLRRRWDDGVAAAEAAPKAMFAEAALLAVADSMMEERFAWEPRRRVRMPCRDDAVLAEDREGESMDEEVAEKGAMTELR